MKRLIVTSVLLMLFAVPALAVDSELDRPREHPDCLEASVLRRRTRSRTTQPC